VDTLVSVFLAIIAVSALLQAGFVVALAVAARKGGQLLGGLEARMETVLPAHVETITRLSERTATLADSMALHTERTGMALDDAGEKLQHIFGRTSSLVAHAVSGAGEEEEAAADDEDDSPHDLGVLPGRLGHAYAVFKGLRRALDVWREDEPPPARGPRH
jgi:hypothetical protein